MSEVPLYWARQGGRGDGALDGLAACAYNGRMWSSNPSGECSYERPARGTVCGTMRSMCGADAGCLAINHQSLSIKTILSLRRG